MVALVHQLLQNLDKMHFEFSADLFLFPQSLNVTVSFSYGTYRVLIDHVHR